MDKVSRLKNRVVKRYTKLEDLDTAGVEGKKVERADARLMMAYKKLQKAKGK